MSKGFWIKLAAGLGLALAGGAFLLNGFKPVAVVAEARRSVAVRSVPGTVKVLAKQEMTARCEMRGRVVLSNLQVGKEVQEGEVLIALDSGDLELEMERKEIDLEVARDALEQGSQRSFDLESTRDRLRDARLRFERGELSKAQLEESERSLQKLEDAIARDVASLEVRVRVLENEMKMLERRKEKMLLLSPISGTITEVYVYRGDLIDGSVPVARIISSERLVEVKVSEENFSGIQVGQIARVKFLGYGDTTFSGRVSKALPVADATTQRYTAYLEMEMEDAKLFPGLTGEATITLDERGGAIVVPTRALMGDKIFLVRNGVVSVTPIQRGYGSLTNVEVLKGLEEGDQVIVQDLELFKSGDRVRTQPSPF